MSLHSAFSTFRGNRVPRFKIIEHRRYWFMFSSALVILSIVGLFVPGLKLSIAFEGGARLEYPNTANVSVADVQKVMASYGRPDAEVQIVNGTDVAIRTDSLTPLGDKATTLKEDLAKEAGITPDDINSEDVGPTWGGQISKRMLLALVIFLVLVTLYITLRFEGQMAIGALVALFHDVIITAGVYVLLGREVTPETVIAILTILGFSLYDTVVIYDKVKENTESPGLVAREGYAQVVNMSLNQTIMRSVNTSLVVLLPILSLVLFGGATLKDFAFALFVGVLVGTYSSIFVAAPLLATMKERDPRYRAKGKDPRRAKKAKAEPATLEERAATVRDRSSKASVTTVPPRPRKKKSTAAKRKKR